jgi:site-specific recombinase XerC
VEHRLAVADPREYPLLVLDLTVFRLMDRLALRVSEASHIRRSRLRDVDGELQALLRKKGRKNKFYPIVGPVRDAYNQWMRIRRTITPVPGHEDYLFIHPRTGYRIHRGRAWKRLTLLASRAGLPRDVVDALSPHKLRHSRARHMLDAGRTLAQVKSLLDHAVISTTSVYLDEEERTRLEIIRQESTHE